jgi:hypothetical protein
MIEEMVNGLAVNTQAIELNPDEREELRKLLKEFWDCFALNPNKPTTTTVVQHEIDTGSHRPIKFKPYQVPKAWEDKVKEMIDDMRENNIISPTSTSPWGFPVVLVKKKDGSLRFCVDYRKLNAITKTSSYPIPLISELLDSLNGAKYFSSMDLASGYWQIRMHPDSVEKTAFVSKYGAFMFNVMPFGLVGAPATFQSLMDRIFGDLQWKNLCVYFDDIFVFSKTFKEHILQLREVFTRLRRYQLQAKLSKCQFLRKELIFLGYQVTQGGILPDPDRIKHVQEWGTPKRAKDVRSFVGLCSYYRRFVPHFASIAEPLHRLMGKNSEFKWSPEADNAFKMLKQKLTSAPILIAPDWTQPFILHTDASKFGLGAVLAQNIGGEEKVVAYASKSLNKAQQNYTTSDRECLAIIWGIRHFRAHLLGRKFSLFTDHSALQFINTMKLNRDLSGRLARYQMFLQEYEFEPNYRKGELNANADALSRDPAFESDRDDVVSPINVHESEEELEAYFTGLPTTEELVTLQREDAFCGPIRRHLLEGRESVDQTLPLAVRVMLESELAKSEYWINEAGLLVRTRLINHEKSHCVLIPERLRPLVLHHSHSDQFSAHLGIHKTYEKMLRRYHWNGMFRDVQNLVASCPQCNSRKFPKRNAVLPPLPLIPDGAPWSEISFDAMGPLPKTSTGKQHIIVFTDRLTKYCEAFAVERVDEITVADLMTNEIVPRHGCPRTILSDGAKAFNSELMEKIFVLLNARKITTTPYNPQHNGQVERFNHTLVQMLSAYVRKDQKDWDRHLGLVLGAYHSCPHSTTGYSPNYMSYGRELPLPIDQILQQSERYQNLEDYFSILLKRTSFAQDLAKARMLDRAARLEEQQTDLQYRIDYNFGERVYLFVPDTKKGLTNKMRSRWHGPYQVLMRVGPVNYRIMRRLDNGTIETRLVNVRRMKPYTEPNQLARAAQRISNESGNENTENDGTGENSDGEESREDDDEYEVEEIRGKRIYRGKVQYLVKWKGYGENEKTWEPLEHLVNSDTAVAEYEMAVREEQPSAQERRNVVPETGSRKKARSRLLRSRLD